jgi:hypothetical protein
MCPERCGRKPTGITSWKEDHMRNLALLVVALIPNAALFQIIFALAPHARAETNSGTIVVVGISRSKVVVAADSRVKHGTMDGFKYDDNNCKIITPSGKLIFVIGGNAQAGVEPDYDRTGFDGYLEARRLFTAVQTEAGSKSNAVATKPDKIREIADKWQNAIEQRVRKIDPKYLAQIKRDLVTSGFFAWLEPDGSISAFVKAVYRPGAQGQTEWDLYPRNESMSFFSFGSDTATNIAQELIDEKTDRAIKEARKWERDTVAIPSDQIDWRKAIRLVELTIYYHPLADKAEIGGKVDAVQLETGRGITWVQNEKKCPED